MEDKCYYVSSRGLLKSCDVYNKNIGSSDPHLDLDIYLNIRPNDVVYVCNSAIENFFKNIFPLIQHKFILVSGDSDVSMPFQGYENYVNDEKLIVWFSQNLIVNHPKLKHLPIGLDYHTISKLDEIHPWGTGMLPIEQDNLLIYMYSISEPLQSRIFGCYVNFHFSEWGINQRGDRQECLNIVPKDLCYFEPLYLNREYTWRKMSSFKFVLCPYGGGLDTHRLWEAVALGCIPIIKTSGLDPLFEDLNVCVVNSWNELSVDFLANFLNTMKPMKKEKLTLEYWVEKIKSYKESDK
uniref:Exostosin GT47 domain-containing protein n=1 Tax=viral metagenome TaxID=1070528 RepID=A0A6C0D6W0_9ZZZZ